MQPLLPLLCVSALLLGAGCVSPKYQKAPRSTPPPVSLRLPATPSTSLQAEVETVIVHDGPGSWKRRAFWDEYVLTLVNAGPEPVRVLSAILDSGTGQLLLPGDDWETLERDSADWWKRNATPEDFVLGAGMTALAAGGGASLLLLTLAMGVGAAPLAGVALGGLVVSGGSLMLLEAPSRHAKDTIAAEFARRRLELPQTIAPGDAVCGSAFFRITPSPRQLILRCERAGRVERVTIGLAVLSGLHRKPGRAVERERPVGTLSARAGPTMPATAESAQAGGDENR